MKKTLMFITILVIAILSVLTVQSNAAELTGITTSVSKTTVNPDENVTLSVNFGANLGAYTFYIAYDNALFDYVSATGGTATDDGTKITVVYYDNTGGDNPRSNLSVTFKAKTGITTSNPTNFAITATGLANPDGTVTYDDITVALNEDIIVEPDYKSYTISLDYDDDIIKDIAKDMTLSLKSSMGKYYDQVRLVVDVTGPDGSDVSLIGTNAGVDIDLVQSGWGDTNGYAIGGANVNQTLSLIGTFSLAGDYSITIKLIDRSNSDAVIATTTKTLTVKETAEEETEELPTKLPQTGETLYVSLATLVALTGLGYMYTIKNKK